MFSTNKISFLIPVRIECAERLENLSTVVGLLKTTGCKIHILEADQRPTLKDSAWIQNVEYEFVYDVNPLFHRTRYINKLLVSSNTEISGIWDTDVLVPIHQIMESVRMIEEGNVMVYPYNGEFVMLDKSISTSIRKKIDFDYLKRLNSPSFRGRRSCGDAFIVDRKRYLSCGAENERFKGWGLEDEERRRRVKILGYNVEWIPNGRLYHLYHPIGKNSRFFSTEISNIMREEFVKECGFNRNEMIDYIQNMM